MFLAIGSVTYTQKTWSQFCARSTCWGSRIALLVQPSNAEKPTWMYVNMTHYYICAWIIHLQGAFPLLCFWQIVWICEIPTRQNQSVQKTPLLCMCPPVIRKDGAKIVNCFETGKKWGGLFRDECTKYPPDCMKYEERLLLLLHALNLQHVLVGNPDSLTIVCYRTTSWSISGPTSNSLVQYPAACLRGEHWWTGDYSILRFPAWEAQHGITWFSRWEAWATTRWWLLRRRGSDRRYSCHRWG